MRTLLLVLLLSTPAVASAIELAADVGGARITGSGGESGFAADLRLGWTSRAGEVAVTSELGALHASMGDARTWGALAGWRLRFGKLLQPGAIVHLGVGHFSGAGLEGFTDALWQVGGLLDLAPAPRLLVGLHFKYSGFFAGARQVLTTCAPADPRCDTGTRSSPNWIDYGVHVSVRL